MVDKETGVILWLEHVCGSSLDCERFSEHFSGRFSAKVSYLCFYSHLPSRAANREKSRFQCTSMTFARYLQKRCKKRAYFVHVTRGNYISE